MDPASFLKVIMLTAFLSGGEVVYQEHTHTTLAKCGQAKEEADSFNNRFRWPWDTNFRNDRRVFVVCVWDETRET